MVRIALSGQIYNTSGLLFTFPDQLTTHPQQDWLQSLQEDARIELRSLTRMGNKTKAYAIWSNACGYYYAAFYPTTSGYMMITICTEQLVVSDGTLVLDMLEQLREYFLPLEGAHQIDPNFVAGAANAIREALIDAPKPYSNGVRDNAYRTYQTENELTDILQYAYQAEYANFKRVYIMDQDMTDTQSKYQRIVTRIKKTYQVVCPEGVTASATEVVDGQEVTICYQKEGYREITKTLIAGQESDIAGMQGCYINVHSAEELGLKFIRIFRFDVRDEQGNILPSYTIGSKVFSAGKWISIPARSVDLVVASEGYQPHTVHIDVNQVKNEDVVLVTLSKIYVPETKTTTVAADTVDIILKVDTGTEVLSAPITITAQSPLCKYLDSLNGKALKAPEALISKPEKKEEEKQVKKEKEKTKETGHSGNGLVAPKFPDYSDHEKKPESRNDGGDTKTFITVVAILGAFILIIVGGIGYRLGWFGEKEPPMLQPTTTITENDTTDVTAEEQEQVADAPEEPASTYKYLDENNTWNIKETTNQEEKDIIALFQKREVTKLIESKNAKLINNTKFREILRIISPFTPAEKQKVADIFEKNSKENIVELSKILPEIQKLRNESKGPSPEEQKRNAAAAEKTNVKVTQE